MMAMVDFYDPIFETYAWVVPTHVENYTREEFLADSEALPWLTGNLKAAFADDTITGDFDDQNWYTCIVLDDKAPIFAEYNRDKGMLAFVPAGDAFFRDVNTEILESHTRSEIADVERMVQEDADLFDPPELRDDEDDEWL
jgi:hypothetical protein